MKPHSSTTSNISNANEIDFNRKPLHSNNTYKRTASVFDIPELVYKIIEYADYPNTVSPHNVSLGNLLHHCDRNILFTCLQVNRLFNTVAIQLLSSQIVFTKDRSLYQFVRSQSYVPPERMFRPRQCILSRLFSAKQSAIDALAQTIDSSALQRIEIFMCPKLRPDESLLHTSLRTLVMAWSEVTDDSFIMEVAHRCPNLEVLDLRACEQVSDFGVYAIAMSCRNLVSVNLGRKNKGHLVTGHSLTPLFARNRRLKTVGLAGCYVSDHSLWVLAIHAGGSIEQLSLNGCPRLTNRLLPIILHHNFLPNLSVLEICFLTEITNMSPIVALKRRQHAQGSFLLVKACPVLQARIRETELSMDNVVYKRIYQDLFEWANANDEEDEDGYMRLLYQRRRQLQMLFSQL